MKDVRLGFFDDDAGIDENRVRIKRGVDNPASVCFGDFDDFFGVSGIIGTAVGFGVEGEILQSRKCFFGAGEFHVCIMRRQKGKKYEWELN